MLIQVFSLFKFLFYIPYVTQRFISMLIVLLFVFVFVLYVKPRQFVFVSKPSGRITKKCYLRVHILVC